MIILNTKTMLQSAVNLNDYSTHQLQEIYDFYTQHKTFVVVIDGEIQC